MAPRCLLLCLAAAGALLLGAGCQTHDSRRDRARVPTRMAVTTGLLLVPAKPLSAGELAAERTRIITYLRERSLLEPDDILVDDLAAADRIIRVVIGENGGYIITDFGGDRRLERGDVYAAPPPGPFVYESPFLPWGLAAASWYYTTSPYAPGYFPGYYDYLPGPRHVPPPRPVVSPPAQPSKPERPHRPHDPQAPGWRDRPPRTPPTAPPAEGPRRPRPPHAERPDVRPPPSGDRPRPSSPPPASAHPRPAPAPARPAPPPTPPPAPKPPPPEKTERTPSANDSLRTHAN